MNDKHVVVIGAGITGLSAALRILSEPNPPRVTVFESLNRIGGVIHASPFAGIASLDESADAFLTRTPSAMDVVKQVGLANALTTPATGEAYIWKDALHPIPHGTMLGVPGSIRAAWSTPLLSTAGKIRASFEPLLPNRVGRNTDNLGAAMRARCGSQVLERIIDPLVGSIYATDTDAFSVKGMPQIADLLAQPRSLMSSVKDSLAKRVASGPIFAAPQAGMHALTTAIAERVKQLGGVIELSAPVRTIDQPKRGQYFIQTDDGTVLCDAVVMASPARHSATLVQSLSKDAAAQLAAREHASVVMIALTVPRAIWPQHLTGSGYLVPKPEQTAITAVSFASNKWSHVQTANNSMVLRVSLGRDGMPMHHLDDETLLKLALADLYWHLGIDLAPADVRITRWVESFPQYRPGHFEEVDRLEHNLDVSAPGVVFAGASYRGIGIPSCIADANRAAARVLAKIDA
jgi:oxygen-dependent protoporphyrinogen oxidase